MGGLNVFFSSSSVQYAIVVGLQVEKTDVVGNSFDRTDGPRGRDPQANGQKSASRRK